MLNQIKKNLIAVFLVLLSANIIYSQTIKNPLNYLFGRWKCVKLVYGKADRYTVQQGKQLEASILIITPHKISYEGANFIPTCTNVNWRIDRDRSEVYYLTWRFAIDTSIVIPFNDGSNSECFNNTALDLYKDTLYNDCGGDYYIRVKVPYETKEYTGTGSDKKEFILSAQAYNLKLTYDFFKEPDKLEVCDQNGKELYHTDMTATNGKQVIVIPIVGVTKLTFKITSEVQSSQWSFKAETE